MENREEKAKNNEPIVETRINKSEDGKWLLFQTTITSIKPINYIKKIMEGA